MSPVHKHIGAQIRRFRYQLEWSQEHLASELQRHNFDISRSGVAKIEAGLRKVSAEELIIIATAMNFPVANFYPARLEGESARQYCYRITGVNDD